MSGGRRYVLDANVFIEAYRKYYAFNICPGFWRALVRQHESKRVFSIDRVKSELTAGGDELSDWTKHQAPDSFFKQTLDKAVQNAFSLMMKWVQAEQQFDTDAKAQFASAADGWVIAYANVNHLVVVTHEEYAPDVKRKVPMPNVCIEFGVDYCNSFEMLRDLKVQFVLKKRLAGR